MDAKKEAGKIFQAAIEAVDPCRCVAEHIDYVRETYGRMGFERLFVIAFGKAAWPMCRAVEASLGDMINEGVAITKYDHGGPLQRIRLYEASHPIPNLHGVEGTREIIDLLSHADEKTLLLCLISGGGSALLVAPCDGIDLEDKQKTTDLLLNAGAEIGELNAVRKHLSAVKGGRLAELASPASVISLILSDVINDPLDVIASGPTSPDLSSFRDALDVLEKYKVRDYTPPSVMNLFTAGSVGMIAETPKGESEIFSRVKNEIIGSNRIALNAAKKAAESLGLKAVISSADLKGEAKKIGEQLAAFAVKEKDRLLPGEKCCFISGGETTVTVRGEGKGGRNMELALAFALKINGLEGITLLSAGTDGTDGPTDAAGAVVDGRSVERGRGCGLDADEHLKNNDSYHFFRKTGELLITGPTGTNVMDLQILLLG